MTGLRPYLIQAVIDWVVDNDCTPHAAIDCTVPGTEGVADYATDGKLVLNLSAKATRNLRIDDHAMRLDCRFRGRAVHVDVPIGAVFCVFARETGQGLPLGVEAPSPAPPEDAPREAPPPTGRSDARGSGARGSGEGKRKGRPSLKLVK